MAAAVRWGILGTGVIARKFAEGLRDADGAVLAAVGSRTQATADAFGDAYGVPNRHASYEALAADPEVDIVYVSTPHPMHKANSLLCIAGGKHVLCEKPFTINAADAEEVLAAGNRAGVFVMEAMWTRFLPATRQVMAWIAEGAIGEVRMVEASFGFRADPDETSRLLDPALGGGALLDVGVYPISYAQMLFGGAPDTILGAAHLGSTGVDEQSAYVLRFPNGGLATLSSAVRTTTPHHAHVIGTGGWIHVHDPFWCAQRVTLQRGDHALTLDLPYKGNGYTHEAEAAMQCVRAGKREHEYMSHADTLRVMETMDALRAQWAMRYPGE